MDFEEGFLAIYDGVPSMPTIQGSVVTVVEQLVLVLGVSRRSTRADHLGRSAW